MVAARKTPTQANGGSDNGVTYTNLVDAEIAALWRLVGEPLINVGGTANAITADADSAIVSTLTTVQKGKKVTLLATATNTSSTVTLRIDGGTIYTIKDINGNALAEGAITNGRFHVFEFDGTYWRLLTSGASTTDIDHGVNGGRLTNSTNVPVLTAAVTAATSLYWTPFLHNRIGLYDGVAWAIVASTEKSIKATDAQTGTTHNGTKIIDGLTDTSQLIVGMKISGTGIGVGATIQSVDSATQVTATVNSTADGTVTVTFKLPANTGFDVYGKKVSSALKLFFVTRAAIFTPTTNTLQDGVTVKNGDTTLRWLGFFKTSNTDGQIDYNFTGVYRFSIYNHDNRIYRTGETERFTSSGTWTRSPCTANIHAFVIGGGGGSASSNGGSTGTTGGTTSFGSHVTATGGVGGGNTAGGAGGAGSGGDINRDGQAGGFQAAGVSTGSKHARPLAPFGSDKGGGGRGLGDTSNGIGDGGAGGGGEKRIESGALGATETVTIGAGGGNSGGATFESGQNGDCWVFETFEA